MADFDNDHVTDPEENPIDTGHLPVSGEVGVGPVPYHDPLTQDTNDDAATTPDDMTLPIDDDPAL